MLGISLNKYSKKLVLFDSDTFFMLFSRSVNWSLASRIAIKWTTKLVLIVLRFLDRRLLRVAVVMWRRRKSKSAMVSP